MLLSKNHWRPGYETFENVEGIKTMSTQREIIQIELNMIGGYSVDTFYEYTHIYFTKEYEPKNVFETTIILHDHEIIPRSLWGIPFFIDFRINGYKLLTFIYFIFEEGILL